MATEWFAAALRRGDCLPDCVGNLFAGNVAMAADKGTAFEIEKLARLKGIVPVFRLERTFHDFVLFHLLRAVAAQAAKLVVLVTERRRSIAVDFRGEWISDADRLVVLSVSHEDRSVDAFVIDHTPEESAHAF